MTCHIGRKTQKKVAKSPASKTPAAKLSSTVKKKRDRDDAVEISLLESDGDDDSSGQQDGPTSPSLPGKRADAIASSLKRASDDSVSSLKRKDAGSEGLKRKVIVDSNDEGVKKKKMKKRIGDGSDDEGGPVHCYYVLKKKKPTLYEVICIDHPTPMSRPTIGNFSQGNATTRTMS